jgi:hypothetical protein
MICHNKGTKTPGIFRCTEVTNSCSKWIISKPQNAILSHFGVFFVFGRIVCHRASFWPGDKEMIVNGIEDEITHAVKPVRCIFATHRATPEQQKMILAKLIEKITVDRDYNIHIYFFVTQDEFRRSVSSEHTTVSEAERCEFAV